MPSIPSSNTDLLSSRPVRVMLSALERDCLSHSLIISGEHAGEVRVVGEHLASSILRHHSQDPSSDRPLDRHPDFLSIRPTGKMRQIGADATRELVRQIHHSPNLSQRKVALLFEAERLHASSANIFLKTLEEPPASTMIVLLTTRPQYLLPTIRSRCLHFRLPVRPSRESLPQPIEDWLETYVSWLDGLSRPVSGKQDVCDRVIRLYGLLSRFSPLLKNTVAAAWKAEKNDLAENLSEEEEAALAEGFRLELRDGTFAAIEQRLRDFALRQMEADTGNIRPFTHSVEQLERMAGLLRVNLNETIALETFLLEVLRAWGRKAG